MAKAPSCRARVAALRWLSPEILEVELAMLEPSELRFEAGQWVAIPLGEKTTRPYSMASPPGERRVVRLCVDVKPGGSGSRYFRGLRLGDEVAFQPPLGTLTLMAGSTAPLLMVAEDVGIVPFRSILLAQAEQGFPRRVRLYFTAATGAHLLYHDELTALAAAHPGFGYRPMLAAPEPAWPGEVGPILPLVEREEGDLRGHDALLCGGGDLVKAARELCLARGIERRRIRYEKFW